MKHGDDTATGFVILGVQRTGTTLIRTALGSHPDILCHGEVFKLGTPYKDPGGYWHYSRKNFQNRLHSLLRPAQFTSRFLERLYARPGHSAIGFKLMLNHCRFRPYIWSVLKERRIKAVLVRRRNLLKTLISRRASAESGVYHVSESLRRETFVKEWAAPKIWIDPATLVHDLDSIDAEFFEWKSRLGNETQHIETVYEDYVADTAAENRAILSFLDVRHTPLSSDLKKVNPDRLARIVKNYDDVAAVLRHTKYAAHLDPI